MTHQVIKSSCALEVSVGSGLDPSQLHRSKREGVKLGGRVSLQLWKGGARGMWLRTREGVRYSSGKGPLMEPCAVTWPDLVRAELLETADRTAGYTVP